MCFAVAVALGDWASSAPWLGVLTVTMIAAVATLVCHALSVGPPGAYMVVLACAAGTGTPATLHLSPGHHAALVLAGGAFAWLVHMSGALFRPRGPEKAAVAAAAAAVAAYIETPSADTRHRAALLLHTAWVNLVTYQPVQPKPDQTLYRLRVVNRRLHVLFAEAMRAAEAGVPLTYDGAALARHLATVPADAITDEHGAEGVPLGRPSIVQLLRRAMTPGSVSLQLTVRVGIAVAISGVIAVLISQALTMTHAYWAMAAAVLMLHQGFDWQRTVARGVERTLGTWLGLGVAGAILALHPQGLWLALVIGALQFVIEMYVVRNYTLAVVFITPAALTIASGGQPVDNLGELLLTRGSDTLIGCAGGPGRLLGDPASAPPDRPAHRDRRHARCGHQHPAPPGRGRRHLPGRPHRSSRSAIAGHGIAAGLRRECRRIGHATRWGRTYVADSGRHRTTRVPHAGGMLGRRA